MSAWNYLRRAAARARSKGLSDMLRYSSHVVTKAAMGAYIDLRYGGRLSTTRLKANPEGVRAIMHTDYYTLRDAFEAVPVRPDDVLVDVGCGDGRVLAFWLSRGLRNQIIGIELNEATAASTARRFAKHPNIKVVQGDAAQIVPEEGTVFFLYNTFPVEPMRRFEEKVRALRCRIVYYNFYYPEVFSDEYWDTRSLISTRDEAQYRILIATRREIEADQRRGRMGD